MTTPTVSLSFPVPLGATFRETFRRFNVQSDVTERAGQLVYKATGRAVPEADKVPEDYTGCTAVLQMRRCHGDSEVLLTFSTDPDSEHGRITLGEDGTVSLYLSLTQVAALSYGDGPGQWRRAVGHMFITFSNGDVLRHFEIHLQLDPGGGACHV